MTLSRRFLLAASAGLVTASGLPALAQAPRRGGSLTASWGGFEPQALFVPGGGGSSPFMTSTKVLERLLAYTADLRFQPVLATAIEPSADFRSYRVVLRQGVTWHDGRPFTAEDVVFTVQELWKPIALGVALKALEGVEAEGSHAVVLRFSSPVPEFFFRSTLASQFAQVIPKHVYAGRDIITNPANNRPIGTGPWVVKEWVRGSHVEYARNENYWDAGKPYLDRLFIRWWRDPASRAAAFEAGALDLGLSNPVPPPEVDRLVRGGNFIASTDGYQTASWCSTVEFNQRRDPVKRREVRQAILHGIDRQFIADTVYFGRARPGVSPIHSGNGVFFSADVPTYAFDPERAARLLDAAGLPKRRGGRFAISLVAAGWFEENVKIGQYLKQALEDLDIAVTLAVPDRATSLKRIYTDYDYDIAVSNYTAPIEPVPVVTQYFTSDGIVKGAAFRNATGFSLPAMDDVVGRLAVETDEARRKTLAHDFARLAATEVPHTPLVEFESFTVARKGVRNHSLYANQIGESWADLWVDG
ncbi:ABC transporter substrate-binding protein [Pseudoroseomonas cervicalis]|uniref:ABC transporter substrate-binding protein n=1 Tax=Teichococcus cervicalis TaxID=204525 RepID=UPI0027884803|nr:ABC transporter substrate-binding protein [Pseudoroseomonas cervicalis]MDQ1081688.1 peptide/nickel transport system substrate-binding protein [Pseudoroseomonas cervicalis]